MNQFLTCMRNQCNTVVLLATSIYILPLPLVITGDHGVEFGEGKVVNSMHQQKFPQKIGIRDTGSIKVPQPFLVSTRRKLSLQILGG